ncbi:hypothetical protein AB0I81_50990 [Nonomuraea sp. NPDC050404]|uniref:hypothetical protein n=1 Tax=Nonomuraea sp. NPDC050404 TaxID=3155783 RepID=UPI0033F65DAB
MSTTRPNAATTTRNVSHSSASTLAAARRGTAPSENAATEAIWCWASTSTD